MAVVTYAVNFNCSRLSRLGEGSFLVGQHNLILDATDRYMRVKALGRLLAFLHCNSRPAEEDRVKCLIFITHIVQRGRLCMNNIPLFPSLSLRPYPLFTVQPCSAQRSADAKPNASILLHILHNHISLSAHHQARPSSP